VRSFRCLRSFDGGSYGGIGFRDADGRLVIALSKWCNSDYQLTAFDPDMSTLNVPDARSWRLTELAVGDGESGTYQFVIIPSVEDQPVPLRLLDPAGTTTSESRRYELERCRRVAASEPVSPRPPEGLSCLAGPPRLTETLLAIRIDRHGQFEPLPLLIRDARRYL
jgi:hypothetical protein